MNALVINDLLIAAFAFGLGWRAKQLYGHLRKRAESLQDSPSWQMRSALFTYFILTFRSIIAAITSVGRRYRLRSVSNATLPVKDRV